MPRSIKVDTGELRKTAGEIETLAGEYDGLYKAIMTEVDNMSKGWQFDDFSAYKQEIETMIPSFTQLRNVINEFRDFLNQAAATYEQVQDTAVREAKNIIK